MRNNYAWLGDKIDEYIEGLKNEVKILSQENESLRAQLENSPIYPPSNCSGYTGIEGYIPELKATVRECIDCGCLTPGGPTRCKRCAKEALR